MGLANARANALAVSALLRECPASVVELGCGPGFALRALLRSNSVQRVTGLDWSGAMLVDAARRNRSHLASGRLMLVRGDFARLPFADRVVDAVLGVNIAYFIDERDGVRELGRVLRPGGSLVLYATEAVAMRRWPFADAETHRLFDRRSLATLLQDGGFSVRIEAVDAGFGIPGLIAIGRR